MERSGTATGPDQARVAAETLSQVIAGTLFGDPPGDLKSKQDKPDTERGWPTVQGLAAHGVPYAMFLHQRHYGGGLRSGHQCDVHPAGRPRRGRGRVAFQGERCAPYPHRQPQPR